MRRALLILIALPGLLHALRAMADNSLPSPPPGNLADWQPRCVKALESAQQRMERYEPFFTNYEIKIQEKPRGVRFDAQVKDREHARFFNKNAHYFVTVEEKPSKEPGELGGGVGGKDDQQASLGFSRWTRQRFAVLDVQIAEGDKVRLFGRLFKAAVAECLR